MSVMENHAAELGCQAEDRVTGYKGVITSLSFDLYVCVQFVISPPMNDKGEIPAGNWFDANRVRVTDAVPVMRQPNFSEGYVAEGNKGAADKPLP